jgi:hypothetical protein
MSYRDALDLTARQVLVLATEKSEPPGRISLDTLAEIIRNTPHWNEI